MYCAPNPSLRQHMVSVGLRTESIGHCFFGALVRFGHGAQPLHLRNVHLTVHGRACLRHHLLHSGASDASAKCLSMLLPECSHASSETARRVVVESLLLLQPITLHTHSGRNAFV